MRAHLCMNGCFCVSTIFEFQNNASEEICTPNVTRHFLYH